MEKEQVRPRAVVKSATAFRTISEVSDELDVPQHVLRFWETKFPQVRPLKRGGGRRYYRPEDVALLRRIQRLLYSEGYTIKGVQRLLKDQRINGTDNESLVDEMLGGEFDSADESDAVPMPEVSVKEASTHSFPVVSNDSVPEPPVPISAPPCLHESTEEEEVLEEEVVVESGPELQDVVTTIQVQLEEEHAVVASEEQSRLPEWHRAELLTLRAELLELKALLRGFR